MSHFREKAIVNLKGPIRGSEPTLLNLHERIAVGYVLGVGGGDGEVHEAAMVFRLG